MTSPQIQNRIIQDHTKRIHTMIHWNMTLIIDQIPEQFIHFIFQIGVDLFYGVHELL